MFPVGALSPGRLPACGTMPAYISPWGQVFLHSTVDRRVKIEVSYFTRGLLSFIPE
jgi:hypothetical protein